jgi:Leucine-rich repeat (LRR) protein
MILNQFPVDRHIMLIERNCVTIAAFLILRSVTVSMECPEFCECRDEALKCRRASLVSVPSDLSGKTVSIDLSFNSISILHKNSFDNMPCLDTVVVGDNSIKQVHPEVFWGLQNLSHLDMHNNNIDYIHPNTFRYNPSLSKLDMHNNNIDYIHPNTFRNNPSLSKLDLSRNELKRLRDVFNSTEELKFLNLSSNNLTYEDLTVFLPVTSLQILDLSNNEIETMREEIFEGMVALKHLNISGNPRLEYDCRLRTLWALCSEQNISCVTDDEQSFRMVVNLHCGTEKQLEDLSLTDESDGFIKTGEYSTEGGVQEGSGTEPVEGITDIEMKEVNSTETVFKQSTDTSDNDEALKWIIVESVCGVSGVVLVIGLAFLIRRCTCPRVETAGNLSPTNSFWYFNIESHFTGSNRSPRSGNKSSYSQCERKILTGSDRSISRYQDANHIVAEITRVPSFKTRVAAPLNPPEEICM